MLEAIISYLQQTLQAVFPDIQVYGLAVKYTDSNNDGNIQFPAMYCANGQYQQIDIDFKKGVIYFRQNGDTRHRTLSADESPDFSIYEERTFSLRVVATLPKDVYKTDNAFTSEKIAENFSKALTVQAKKVLLDALTDADDINVSVSSRITEPERVWNEEYSNIDFQMPFNKVYLAVNIDVSIVAGLDCFEYWGCLDAPLDVLIPCNSEITLKYEDGTTFKTFLGETATILDNRIYNSDGSLNTTIKPEESFPLPVASYQYTNSDGSYAGTGTAGVLLEIPDRTASNTDNSFSETIVSVKNYTIPNTPLVDSAGASLGSYPSVVAITAPDSTLKDTSGNTITTAKSGGIATLVDSVAKNSLNQTVDTKPYSQVLSVGDSVIFKANGITQLLAIPAENSKTTAQIIALMSAAEVLADTDSALLTSGIVPLLSNSNLTNLTTAQRNYITTLLVSVQMQLLSNTQLALLTAAQKAYIGANSAPTTYNFPTRTFAGTIYQTGDAKWVRDTYFTSLPTGITPRLTDYKNLATYNNIFGNLKRFTGLTGGYQDDTTSTIYYDVNGSVTTEALAFPGDYLIDHYTGLGWIRTAIGTTSWSASINSATSYSITINGTVYSNFFMPDEKQSDSIRTHSSSLGIDAPFVFTTGTLWTSSTSPTTTTSALGIAAGGALSIVSKTLNAYRMYCRKHF